MTAYLRWVSLIVVLALVSTISCRDRRTDPAENQERAPYSIGAAHALGDLAKERKEIRLEATAESMISEITDILVNSQGHIVIADGWRGRQVLVFDGSGKFLRKVGQFGQGPGEYNTPVSLALDPRGKLLICDYVRSQILVFNKDYSFDGAIKCRDHIKHFIRVNSQGNIYSYSGVAEMRAEGRPDTIRQFDLNGNTVRSFAPLESAIIRLGYSVVWNGMAIGENDEIFEMHPLYYRIRKYAPDGRLKTEFGNEGVPDKMWSREKGLIVRGPYCTDRFILIQRGGEADLFDSNGRLLKSGLKEAELVVWAGGNRILLEKRTSDMAVQKLDNNAVLLSYRLD